MESKDQPPEYSELPGQPVLASQVDPGHIVIVQAPVPMGAFPKMRFGEHPVSTTCQNCQSQILTRVEGSHGILSWIICGTICFVGCGCGCCLVPFCLDSLKDYEHFCPNCNAVLGRKSAM